MIPVRHNGLPVTVRHFPPMTPGHPLEDAYCPACDEPLAGCPITLVYVGPGDSAEAQEKARAGRWHSGAAVAVHSACAGHTDAGGSLGEGESPAPTHPTEDQT